MSLSLFQMFLVIVCGSKFSGVPTAAFTHKIAITFAKLINVKETTHLPSSFHALAVQILTFFFFFLLTHL